MLLKAIIALGAIAIATSVPLQAIAGQFSGVDSVRADGLTAWSHSQQHFSPLSQSANSNPAFVSQFAAGLASVAPDGSLFYLSSGNAQYSGTITYVGNVTGARISTRAVRLFGQQSIYTVGVDETPAQDRLYATEHVSSLVALGSGATRRLVVCLNPGSPPVTSPLYLETGLSGSSQFPSPASPDALPTQLIEYATPFLATTSLVQVGSSTAPKVITTDPKYGVVCDSLRAAGSVVYVRTFQPAAYWARDGGGGSWQQITGHGSSNTSQIFGTARGPALTPNDQLRFGFDGSGVPVPHLYSLDPNMNPAVNDSNGARIWRYTGPGSWTSVFQSDALNNATVLDFVAGGLTGTDVFALLKGSSSYVDNKRYPLQQFVWTSPLQMPVASRWQFRDSQNAPWTGTTAGARLHWDAAGKFLVVYGDAVVNAYSTTSQIVPSDPDFNAHQFDNQFFLRRFNYAARLNSDEWIPAYGGGFSEGATPKAIVSAPSNDMTYFVGVSDFVFNRYVGSGVAVYRADLGRWTDMYESAAGFDPLSLGGPLDGATGRADTTAGVADLYQTKLGNDNVLIAGGYFRTALKGTITLNSVVVLPMNADGTVKTKQACGLASNSLTGVRVSTNGVPENYLMTPGLVLAIEYDSTSRQLFVAGTFDSAGDVPASNIAVFQFGQNPSCAANAYTGTWSEVAGGVDGTVFTMERVGDMLYVGGEFTRVGVNQFANNIAAYDIKNRVWITLNAGLDGAVQRIIPHNGAVLAAGKFTSGSGRQFPNVAWWEQGHWHGPHIEKNLVSCGKGCSYACGRQESCAPAWDHVADVRQISKNELIFLGVSGNSSELWRLDTGAKTGFVLINSGGFSTLVADDGALPLGKGAAANELNVWNVHASGDNYPQHMLSVWATDHPSNILYRTGGGVNGAVYSTWPEYDGN